MEYDSVMSESQGSENDSSNEETTQSMNMSMRERKFGVVAGQKWDWQSMTKDPDLKTRTTQKRTGISSGMGH